jgi:hypothetical protein
MHSVITPSQLSPAGSGAARVSRYRGVKGLWSSGDGAEESGARRQRATRAAPVICLNSVIMELGQSSKLLWRVRYWPCLMPAERRYARQCEAGRGCATSSAPPSARATKASVASPAKRFIPITAHTKKKRRSTQPTLYMAGKASSSVRTCERGHPRRVSAGPHVHTTCAIAHAGWVPKPRCHHNAKTKDCCQQLQ